MPIGDEDSQQTELGCDSNPPYRAGRSPDLDTWCVRIIAQNLTMRKLDKAAREGIGPFRRHVYTILRNCFEHRIRRGRCVPIELHIHAARPLMTASLPIG